MSYFELFAFISLQSREKWSFMVSRRYVGSKYVKYKYLSLINSMDDGFLSKIGVQGDQRKGLFETGLKW